MRTIPFEQLKAGLFNILKGAVLFKATSATLFSTEEDIVNDNIYFSPTISSVFSDNDLNSVDIVSKINTLCTS